MAPTLFVEKQRQQTQCFYEDLGNRVRLALVQIPDGTFTMGSPLNEAKRFDSEGPQREVTVTSFLMGRYPVTQAQYKAVMGSNPAEKYDRERFVAPDKPVVGVSWDDAVAFCEALSKQTEHPYRLPSEAEWEYACRAGTTTPFFCGETITTGIANYHGDYIYGKGAKGVYRNSTTPVDHFKMANPWGLCDMHGNAWEWCLDPWHENYKGAPSDGGPWLEDPLQNNRCVIRGGAWSSDPWFCRSAYRYCLTPDHQDYYLGFRVVLAPR